MNTFVLQTYKVSARVRDGVVLRRLRCVHTQCEITTEFSKQNASYFLIAHARCAECTEMRRHKHGQCLCGLCSAPQFERAHDPTLRPQRACVQDLKGLPRHQAEVKSLQQFSHCNLCLYLQNKHAVYGPTLVELTGHYYVMYPLMGG